MQLFYTRSKPDGNTSKSAGYTLVEVLCAVFIAAIMVTVLFVGFDNGFSILRTTREEMRATQILLQKTEAIRLMTWDQLSNCPTVYTESYYSAGMQGTNNGTLFVGKFTVGEATNLSDILPYKPYLKLITITVGWTNFIGPRPVSHQRQMQTMSALGGMQNYFFAGARTN